MPEQRSGRIRNRATLRFVFLRDDVMAVDSTNSDPVTSIPAPKFTLTENGELWGEQTEENLELARRMTACVNACEGISTEELEAGIIQDMRQVIAEVLPVLQRMQNEGHL